MKKPRQFFPQSVLIALGILTALIIAFSSFNILPEEVAINPEPSKELPAVPFKYSVQDLSNDIQVVQRVAKSLIY